MLQKPDAKMFYAKALKQTAEHPHQVRGREPGAVQGLSPSPILALKGELRPLSEHHLNSDHPDT